MKDRIESYGGEEVPLQDALGEIDRQLAEVDRARIRGRLTAAELDASESELEHRREELERKLASLDPGRIEELEEARAMLPAIEELLNWSETYPAAKDSNPIKNFGGFTHFRPSGIPPGLQDLAKLWAFLPPDWWVGEGDKFDDGEWPQGMLAELLDRLHAKIIVHDGYAELEGVLSISVPLGSRGASTISLHASHVPRRLG